MIIIVEQHIVAIDQDFDAGNAFDGTGVVEVDEIKDGAETTALRASANVRLPW